MSLESFLADRAETRSFPPGASIITEGVQAQAAYMVKDGFVTVFREMDGKDCVLARLGPGSVFGEMALLRYDCHTLSVRAETQAELYVIPAALLAEQIRQTPPLVRAILDMLLDRVNETNEALIDLDSLVSK
ncbi:MAG: cyclic nucleotide-binding domain-containing protein [Rhodospirillales bacterium]|nr:cyclic nucleotide-binding domain-containing protein [Rhodospirillales bacterium]